MEKIFNRENKTQIKLTVWFINVGMGWGKNSFLPGYEFSIHIRENGKRKWNDPIDTNSWSHRQKTFPEGRDQDILEQKMKFISRAELHQAFVELWESIKPKI